jgi:hypothetical protein
LQDFYFPTETLSRKLRAIMDAGFLFWVHKVSERKEKNM